MAMTPRERLLATAAFEPPDRPFRMETLGFWNETFERWHREGLPGEINEVVSATLYFGCDPQIPIPIGDSDQSGFFPAFEEEVIEDRGEYVIKRDVSGSIVQVLASGASTIPSIIEAPVKDVESWNRVKERLDPSSEGRLDQFLWILDIPGSEEWPMWVYLDGLFGTHRHLLGFTPLMIAYKRQPDLLKAIARHWVSFWRGIIEKIAERRRPDAIYVWEDMCYKNGPMIGPKAFEEFMAPYYRDLIGFARDEMGVPVVCVDTDGDLLELVPKFVDAGVNMLVPWEVQAGMDVVAVRREWPSEFVIWGGIDKRALYEDRKAIDEEVMRVVPPMLEAGGYIPAIDHAVPPEVSLENWRYFLELVRDLGDKHCA